MCGIIGYCGNGKTIEILKNGLKRLEYRGYDSAGISFFENGVLKTIKKAGSVDNLFLSIKNVKSHIGIGHTRWATHGKPTDENSHPHLSFDGKVAVVHNGIIENYLSIKKNFLSNVHFKSETDTEVISNLIEFFCLKGYGKLESLQKSVKLMKGSFAIAVVFADDDSRIYFAKNLSPLLIGIGKTENFLSSDILGFANKTKKYVLLDDYDYGYISKQNVSIFDKFDAPKVPNIQTMQGEIANASKNGYAHFMLKEINEVKTAVKNTALQYANDISPIEKLADINKKGRFFLIACGTSFHSCLVGEKYFQKNGTDATALLASEFIYSAPPIDKNCICIFVSQSGETADTLSAVKIAKQFGATTIGITNVKTSQLTRICDYFLPICSGPEIAVASTKAYNSQVALLNILANFVKYGNACLKKNIGQITTIADKIDIENFDEQIKPLVKEVLTASNIFVCGKDFDYVASLESALKLKEISYFNAQGIASGEFKHGTIALVDDKTLIFAFLTQPKIASKTLNIVKQTKARGAKIVAITSIDENFGDFDFVVHLPKASEDLMPIIAVTPMQLLAYRVAVTLGHNPDKPRNLAKSVTVE